MSTEQITDLVPAAGDSSMVASLPDTERAREFIQASKAESTLRGYRADWREFYTWCEGQHVCPLPAPHEAVAAYIAECASHLKVGSIQRRLNAIAEAHKAVGLESPTHHAMVMNTMKGIRRTKGTAPAQKAPALTDDIRAMVDATDVGIIGTRDRALILAGFAGAFRRSELVALDIEDCTFGKDGLTILLRRSKTDQDSAGRKIGIRTVRILKHARYVCYRRGSSKQESPMAQCSARSVVMGEYKRGDWLPSMLPA